MWRRSSSSRARSTASSRRSRLALYTFLADYLPQASYDAMEHRNSTVITAPGSITNVAHRSARLGGARVLPRHGTSSVSVREASSPSTSIARTRLGSCGLPKASPSITGRSCCSGPASSISGTRRGVFTSLLDTIGAEAGRLTRSAEEISRMAVVTDSGGADRSSGIGDVSYYHLGAAIALSLDLSIRQRSNGQLSLDDFMRRDVAPLRQARRRASGIRRSAVYDGGRGSDAGRHHRRSRFARDFFARYIQGRELADYRQLLTPAGFLVRRAPGGSRGGRAGRIGWRHPDRRAAGFRDSWLVPIITHATSPGSVVIDYAHRRHQSRAQSKVSPSG